MCYSFTFDTVTLELLIFFPSLPGVYYEDILPFTVLSKLLAVKIDSLTNLHKSHLNILQIVTLFAPVRC